MLRYRTDETDDGLSGEEGTFLICSFWLVSAFAIIGEEQRARELMERLLREASPWDCTPRSSTPTVAATRELSAGVLASRPDRGGSSDHRRRAPRGIQLSGTSRGFRRLGHARRAVPT